MVHGCCVPFCKSQRGKEKNVTFHVFPLDTSLWLKWVVVLARKGETEGSVWVPCATSTVCSKHFTEDDFVITAKTRKIKHGAVPSLFPNYPKSLQRDTGAFRRQVEPVKIKRAKKSYSKVSAIKKTRTHLREGLSQGSGNSTPTELLVPTTEHLSLQSFDVGSQMSPRSLQKMAADIQHSSSSRNINFASQLPPPNSENINVDLQMSSSRQNIDLTPSSLENADVNLQLSSSPESIDLSPHLSPPSPKNIDVGEKKLPGPQIVVLSPQLSTTRPQNNNMRLQQECPLQDMNVVDPSSHPGVPITARQLKIYKDKADELNRDFINLQKIHWKVVNENKKLVAEHKTWRVTKSREIRKLKAELADLKELHCKVLNERKKLSTEYKARNIDDIQKCADEGDTKAIFVMDQVMNLRRKKYRWSETTMDNCNLWYSRSPSGYQHARQLGFLSLPGREAFNQL